MPEFPLQDLLRAARDCHAKGDVAKARATYQAILRQVPGNAEALAALAALDAPLPVPKPVTMEEIGRLNALLAEGQAATIREQCLALLPANPGSYFLWLLLGSANKVLGSAEAAVTAFEQALAIRPDDPLALQYKGEELRELQRFDEAAACFARLRAINPYNLSALSQELQLRVKICDWTAYDDIARHRKLTDRFDDAVGTFTMLGVEDNPQAQLERARMVAARFAAECAPPLKPWARPAGERIRLGYFSGDFHDHPVLHCMSGLFREHDRSRFEVTAFSFGPERPAALREQLKQDVEHFVDIDALDFDQTIALVRGMEIDIAIDLMGYTGQSRTGLFARRLAPLQLSFLGFAGTMGADFIDGIVADPVLVPEGAEAGFSERVLRMPHSYMPADNRRVIGPPTSTRGDHGLPDDALVLCCFNQSYKVGPREFAIWMNVLRQVDDAVLWLKPKNAIAEQSMRRAAGAAGVDPARLVFAGMLPYDEHLERHRHAALYLDAFNINAHSMGCDALWAGLPLVTKAGAQYAARVGASLVTAAGLPELVTHSEAEYEALILDLARDRDRLAALRAKLAANIASAPLFDTVRYTRDFEALLASALDESRAR